MSEDLLEPPVRHGVVRLLFLALGLSCVGLAVLGAVLPGLPTTPFCCWLAVASFAPLLASIAGCFAPDCSAHSCATGNSIAAFVFTSRCQP